MDVREKLVEFLEVDLSGSDGYEPELIADYLLANGVTVQARGYWASLTDCANAGVYCSVCHKKVYKEDYAGCNRKNKLRSAYCSNCGGEMMTKQQKEE